MAHTHKITYTHNRGIGANVSKQSSVSEGNENNLDEVFDSISTDREIDWGFLLANVKSLFICADGEVTIKTNDSATPDDTFVIDTDKPLVWNVDSFSAIPFTEDVTKIYVTMEANIHLQGFCLIDPTP